jgi:hypothetical protein
MKYSVIEVVLIAVFFLSSFIKDLRYRPEIIGYRFIQYILGMSLLATIGCWQAAYPESNNATPYFNIWYNISVLIHLVLTFVFVYYLFYFILPYVLEFCTNKGGRNLFSTTLESLQKLQKKQLFCTIMLICYSVLVHMGYIIGFLFLILGKLMK